MISGTSIPGKTCEQSISIKCSNKTAEVFPSKLKKSVENESHTRTNSYILVNLKAWQVAMQQT